MYYSSSCTRLIKTKKKGKVWQAILKYKDASGEWKNLSKMLPEANGIREAKKLAEEWRVKANEEASNASDGSGLRKNERTVSEIFYKYLDYQLSIGQLEQSTYDMQKCVFKKNIEPYLGDIIFDTLDRTQIINWHTQLASKGISQHSIYYNYTVISKVYNYYVDIGEIVHNPFKQVKAIHKSKKHNITHLTADQMEDFVASVYLEFEPKDPMYAGLFLAYYAGLRRGEICGLRWRDIDFETNTISVETAIGVAFNGTYTKNPKNKSSTRKFPMVPQLVNVLKERYRIIKPEKSWFVIGERENYMTPKHYSNAFKRFVSAYNLVDAYGKHLTSHALRHNMATVGIRSKMDIASLSLMLGHASRAMTLDVYGDANENAKLEATKALSKTFRAEGDLEPFAEGSGLEEDSKNE